MVFEFRKVLVDLLFLVIVWYDGLIFVVYGGVFVGVCFDIGIWVFFDVFVLLLVF